MVLTFEEIIRFVPTDEDTESYNNLINVLDHEFPHDWRSWQVANLSYADLFGETISPDTECRLRFAVPTVDLINCFDANASSISERKFKCIKRKLIRWPIGRALIYAPHAIMEKMHKGEFYLKFMDTVKHLKPRLISRSGANAFFKEKEGGETPSSSQSRRRTWSEEETAGPPEKRRKSDDQLMTLIKKQNEMFSQLIEMSAKQFNSINDLKQQVSTQAMTQPENTGLNESFESVTSTQDAEENPRQGSTSPSARSICGDTSSWQAPPFHITETQGGCNKDLYNFNPDTTESEQKIANADLHLARQGEQCQRFCTQGWSNIRYADVQKQFQATPVFSNLKVNSILATVTPHWQPLSTLERMDLCLGAVSHGLLKQRKHFQDIYDQSPPDMKVFISTSFLGPDSAFRKTSDALLQYVCGRRAEIIQQRRAVYKTRNKHINELLQSIPPSPTHLFSENALSDLIKEQGGINKFFLDSSKRSSIRQNTDKRSVQTRKTNYAGKKHYKSQNKDRPQAQSTRPSFTRKPEGPSIRRNQGPSHAKGRNKN